MKGKGKSSDEQRILGEGFLVSWQIGNLTIENFSCREFLPCKQDSKRLELMNKWRSETILSCI